MKSFTPHSLEGRGIVSKCVNIFFCFTERQGGREGRSEGGRGLAVSEDQTSLSPASWIKDGHIQTGQLELRLKFF